MDTTVPSEVLNKVYLPAESATAKNSREGDTVMKFGGERLLGNSLEVF